ncbi:MAG TPA: hypothetical protein VMW45_02320 [Dehalococcoidia bacterium]|nr:hypothetical protein [Dehalococcoidia bacterium]
MFKALKKIDIHTFMDTPEEWHSFVIGFCEVMCPWRPFVKPQGDSLDYIQGEYHYYAFGRAVGFLALAGLVTGIIKVVLG